MATGILGQAGELSFRQPWPPWIMILLMVLGAGYVIFLYRREQSVSPGRRMFLGGLRISIYLILIALLFEPVLTTARDVLIRSQLLVLLDVSESMAIEDPRTGEKDLRDAALALGKISMPGVEAPAPEGSRPEKPRELTDEIRSQVASASRLELARGILNHPDLKLLREPDERRQIRYFRFGERLEPAKGEGETLPDSILRAGATGQRTQLGTALQEAVNRFSGHSIDGILILTDGASNGGLDPLEVARRLKERSIPIFPVGLGLTRPDDVRIKAVIVQDTVFEQDRVGVRVEIASSGFQGRTVDLTASLDGVEVARKTVLLDKEAQFEELSFVPRGEAGTRRLEIKLSPLDRETTLDNNLVERSIRVIDEKIKVLYVEGRPRWEYRYLRAVLLRDPRLVVKFLLTEGDPDLAKASARYVGRFPDSDADAARFDLVILGDVPSYFFTAAQIQWIEKLLREDGGSFLLLAGQEHAPHSYRDTPIASILPVKLAAGNWMNVHSSVHPVVTPGGARSQMVLLGATERQTAALWALVRPLYRVPRLEGARPGATVLATLSGGAGPGGPEAYPLIAWQRFGTGKSLFVGTDQLWRLRYRTGDRYHARFWGQAIRFLTLSRLLGENRRIRIETERKEYRSGERVDLYVNALNESYDPILAPAYTVRIEASHLADPVEKHLQAVPGSPGLYQGHFTPDREGTYLVQARPGDQPFASSASFQVTPFRREKLEPDMQEELLKRLAELSGGKYLKMEDLPSLSSRIPAESRVISVPGERELWDHWILFVLLLSLACLEWLMRRRYDLA